MAENSTNKTTTNFSGSIDLSVLRKKRFLIDNDESRVLELDTSDLSIIQRLSDKYPELEKLSREVENITTGVSASEETVKEDIQVMAERLTKIDKEMRACVDYIFDADVSKICAPSGSMYDPINGQLRYEHLITILMGLYEENLSKEMKKIQNRMKSHTDKYTK